jgi:putative multiple sugar transport system substrate-binding protein
LQPKIADGTFIVANSTQADKYKDSPRLLFDYHNLIFNQIAIKNWDPNNARILAKTQLKNATESQKGDVAILAPNDDTARVISDVFRSDKAVKSILITGQDATSASFSYIRSGRQSMTIVKDPRLLATYSIDVALNFLYDRVSSSVTINNGLIEIPTRYVDLLVVDKSNVDSVKPIW